jgi:SAM-dependent methyltransferase
VLDLAAADGNVALAAARRGAEVVACDSSDAMVARGSARAEAAGYDVDWHVCDAQRLPFAAETFDTVASSFGVVHAADARRATSELNRVVRPGGRIGITAWPPTGAIGRALALAAKRLQRPEARTVARWGRYEDAYRRFGFHPAFEIRDLVLELKAPSVTSAVGLLLDAPGPLNARGPAREALEGDLAKLLSAHLRRSDSGIAVALNYVLITARKPSHQHRLAPGP